MSAPSAFKLLKRAYSATLNKIALTAARFTLDAALVSDVNHSALKLQENSGAGNNTVTLKAPDSQSADYTLKLPADDGNSTQLLRTDGSGVLSWVSPPLDLFAHRRAGVSPSETWYSASSAISTLTTANPVRDFLIANPVVVPRACTLDRLIFEVTTLGAAGAKARVGIYSDDGTLYPGTLVADGGEHAVDGATGNKVSTISAVLTPGLYWLAYIAGNATEPDIRSHPTTGLPNILGLGAPSPIGANPQINRLLIAFTYAALPDPFPSGGTFGANQVLPFIAFRVASYQ